MDQVEEARLRRIEKAARAYVEAEERYRKSAQEFNVWSPHDELIYQSPVMTELREALDKEAL